MGRTVYLKPGDVVVVLSGLSSKIRDVNQGELVVGTYMGDLRIEGVECYVLLESNDIWVGLKRELVPWVAQD